MMKKLLFAFALAALMVTSAFAGEVLQNGGFESGALAPWYTARTQYCVGTCVPWDVTNAFSHSGLYSAVDVGNLELRQDFSPTPGSWITNVSFWVYGAGANAVDFFYSDGSDQEFVAFPAAGVWSYVDVTSDVDASRILTGFSIWGTDPSFTTYVDDASITAVPEPGTLVMLGSGIIGLAGVLRRKINL